MAGSSDGPQDSFVPPLKGPRKNNSTRRASNNLAMANRVFSTFSLQFPRSLKGSSVFTRSQFFRVQKSPSAAFVRFLSNSATKRSNGDLSAFRATYAETDAKGRRFPEFELDGRVFVVTGGARGLSLTLAEALVEAGGHGIRSSQPPEPY